MIVYVMIKKDIYLTQFEYFIKKYIMFRFDVFDKTKVSTYSKARFDTKLSNEITKYCLQKIKDGMKR